MWNDISVPVSSLSSPIVFLFPQIIVVTVLESSEVAMLTKSITNLACSGVRFGESRGVVELASNVQMGKSLPVPLKATVTSYLG